MLDAGSLEAVGHLAVILEERYLRPIIEKRFEILEKARTIMINERTCLTLSIGVGHDAKNLAESEKYAKKALEYKDSNRKLADVFSTLSSEEMKHMSMLHAEVVKIIDDYRKANGDPPPGMQMVYDILHEKHIEDAKAVKILQNMYLEN